MKNSYPVYKRKMSDIEKNLSKKDMVILEDYISFCSQNAKGDKLEQRKRYALQFNDIAEVPFKKFDDPKIIQELVSIIKNADREIGGKNECIKQLKFFVNWLFNDANLTKGIRPIRQPSGYNTKKLNPNTLVTEDEQKALVRGAENLKHKAMVVLLLECGLRPHELLALRWENIKFEDSQGTIQIFSSKTNGTRVLPFKTSYVPLMRWKDEFEYPDRKQSDYIFPSSRDRKKPLYRSYIAMLFRKICKQQQLRHINPYLIRHTKLTFMNKILPEKIAAKYGGHSVQVSAKYTHLNDDDIKEIVLDKIYNAKEPAFEEKKQFKKEITLLQQRLNDLEKKEAKRKKADEIINELTKDPQSLKLIARAIAKLGLVKTLIKI